MAGCGRVDPHRPSGSLFGFGFGSGVRVKNSIWVFMWVLVRTLYTLVYSLRVLRCGLCAVGLADLWVRGFL